MDDAYAHAKALKLLTALAEGIHPATGEIFPDGCPCHAPDVIRGLFGAIRLLEAHQMRVQGANRPRSGLPANAGTAWSDEEDRQLLAEFDTGKPLKEIAGLHQRTFAGIEARLEKLGRLTPEQRTTSRRVPPARGQNASAVDTSPPVSPSSS